MSAPLSPATSSVANSTHLNKHINNSKALDISDLNFDDVKNYPLREDEIRVLTYFMDVESNTIIYLKELLSTPAAYEPEIQAFLSTWVYEEFFHGRAIKQFLRAYGVEVADNRVGEMQANKSLLNRLRIVGQTILSKLAGKHFIGVHMAWGAANELATVEGYRRIVDKTEHPILKDMLMRIMKDERRHFAFYFKEAQQRLTDPKTARLTSTLIRRFFEPVGADIRDLEEVDMVALYLFGDEEGLKIVRGVDQKIGSLPALDGFRGLEKSLERTRARYGKTLGVFGAGTPDALNAPNAPKVPSIGSISAAT